MRIVFMSDTHMLHEKLIVPNGDIAVHAGDWAGEDRLDEYEAFFAWFSSLPHPHKVLVAGNHDSLMQKFGKLMRQRIPKNITYLEDEPANVAGLKFWGSPRTPGAAWMAFTHPVLERQDVWSRIPDDTDVLVTHGPPYGILDRNYTGQHIGDDDLMKRVKVIRPKLHLFGHVHDQNGRMERFGTTFINAAVGDDDQDPNLSAKLHTTKLLVSSHRL